MKKFLSCLLIAVITALIPCEEKAYTNEPEKCEIIEDILVVSASNESENVLCSVTEPIYEEMEPVEEDTGAFLYALLESIPLSFDKQELLQDACDEFDVPYALALGLIQKETNFQNIYGDSGDSAGYMQIQQKWHQDRMERLGVTDLSDPESNFRVGLDFLSELYSKYGSWEMALTVYNVGHDPGYITNYAYSVMDNYENWSAVLCTA